MDKDESRCDVALMIRVSHHAESVLFRAYAQRAGQGTVLAWALDRLKTLAPRGASIVCVCDSESEHARLSEAAREQTRGMSVVSLSGCNEMQQCRHVVDVSEKSHVLVVGLCHGAAPQSMLRDLYQLHRGARAAITEAVGGTFVDTCYVVNATFLNLLLNTPFRVPPMATLRAAAQLREEAAARGARASDFLWVRTDVTTRYGVPANKWPETIGITSGRDVEIVRRLLDGTPDADTVGCSFIHRWKRASIQTRQRRLAESAHPVMVSAPAVGRKRVRVLYACHMSAFTGAQQSVCHLIGALDRTRYEPCALVSYEGTFSEELRRRGVEVVCPNHAIIKNDPENVVFARHILRAFAPDLIHASHTIGTPLISAATEAGIPLIQHVRIPDLLTLREHIVAADAVVAVSHFIAQQIAALDVDPDKVHVIWNGVLPDEFMPSPSQKARSRAQFGVPADQFVIAMIARLTRSKRHDIVLAALGLLRRITGRGHLLFIGEYDGDLAYVQEIDSLIVREGLASYISRIPFLRDIRPALHASDALVMPSENEPLSRAVLEGMAVGLPVVAADSGGSQEIIDAGSTGFVVRYGDSVQLGQVLAELAAKPDWAQQIGAAAATKVRTSLTAAACAGKTASLYEHVLSRTTRRCA